MARPFDIKHIAESMDDLTFDGSAEPTIPGFDTVEPPTTDVPGIPNATALPAPEGASDVSGEAQITMDRELLLALLSAAKDKGCGCGCGNPAPDGTPEHEAPEAEEEEAAEYNPGDEEDDSEDEDEDVEIEEGMRPGKPLTEDEDDEDEDEDDSESEDSESDDESGAGEADVEDAADDVEDAANGADDEEDIDYSDCEQLVDKIAELAAAKGTLTMDDFPELEVVLTGEIGPEAEAEVAAAEEIAGDPEAEAAAEADTEAPASAPMDTDEMSEADEMAEAVMKAVEEISEDLTDMPTPVDTASVGEIEPEPLPTTQLDEPVMPQDDLLNTVYQTFGYPGTTIDDAAAQQIKDIYLDHGKDAEDEGVIVRTIDGYMIEGKEQVPSLTESVKALAEDNLKIGVVVRPAKTECGVEFLGDNATFTRLCEAINASFKTIKEGKAKKLGGMAKYSRCFPVHGGGRLFFVFK